jgi:hypothetical protein
LVNRTASDYRTTIALSSVHIQKRRPNSGLLSTTRLWRRFQRQMITDADASLSLVEDSVNGKDARQQLSERVGIA